MGKFEPVKCMTNPTALRPPLSSYLAWPTYAHAKPNAILVPLTPAMWKAVQEVYRKETACKECGGYGTVSICGHDNNPCPKCNPDLRTRLDAALTPEQVKRLRKAVKAVNRAANAKGAKGNRGNVPSKRKGGGR